MFINFKFIFFIIFLPSIFAQTLKTLFIVHRHGDRTSPWSYPNSSYLNDTLYFPDGKGMLTNNGKQRMLDIGIFLRKKYDKFLGDDYRKVEIRSSEKDRCLESNQLLMNGLFKSKILPFQPFPIHTTEYRYDLMLNPNSYCAAAEKELKKIYFEQFEGQEIVKKYHDLYEYVSKKSGLKVDNIVKAFMLYDALIAEKSANYSLPDWITSNWTILDQLKESKIQMNLLYKNSRKFQKLRTGIFFNDLSNKIEKIIKSNSNDKTIKKVYLYSTHDFFINLLMISLGVFNGIEPSFGVTLIFELYHQSELITKLNTFELNELNYIKILYLNDTDKMNYFHLKLPACSYKDMCTIKEFMLSISDLKTDLDECFKNDNIENTSSLIIIEDNFFIFLVLVVVLINLLITFIIFLNKNSNQQIK